MTSSFDHVVIGIFGGSVAHFFAESGELEKMLRERSLFTGRKVTIINLAHPGYKQPQQLMSLAYWLVRGGELDIAINLDGFNEVALHRTENGRKNIAAVYPRAWYARTQKIPDLELRRLVGKLAYLEQERIELASNFSSGFGHFSAIFNLVWKTRDLRIATEIAHAQNEFQKYQPADVPPVVSGPAKEYSNDAEMYGDLVAIWKNSAIQMHRLSVQNDIQYLHFIQPNQYVPNSKPMGANERRWVFTKNYLRRSDVEKGYPLLRSGAKELSSMGVNVHDLTMMFAETEERVYLDNCCHFNERGNELLAGEIARRITEEAPSNALAYVHRGG